MYYGLNVSHDDGMVPGEEERTALISLTTPTFRLER